ncbi:MAG: alpha-ribazole phosphatase [Sulfuricellaceae bacterium]|nr:alpha-ribazole phosphatase [Sulfuricellaceae bacterium]
MKITTIDLLRHGEPVGGKKYRGQSNDPLTEAGWEQMWAAVGEHRPWQRIVTSPLSRCADFSHALAEKLGIPVSEDQRLMEIGFGEWEGKTPQELMEHDPESLLKFWRDPLHHHPIGAEPLSEFAARVSAVWHILVKEYKGEHVLVVAHAGVIRMVMSYVLGMPIDHIFRIQVENAGLTRIHIEGEGKTALPSLVFHGAKL